MIYVTTGAESLLQIAGALTLDPGYYDPIQRANAGSEEINQVPVNQALPAGLQVYIPDDWLQPAVRARLSSSNEPMSIEVVGGNVRPTPAPVARPDWTKILLVVGALLLLAAMNEGEGA